MLGYFRGPTEVGIYRLAKSLATLPRYIITPLQTVTYPYLVRVFASSGIGALRQRIKKFALILGIPLGLLGFAMVIATPFAVNLLLTEVYSDSIILAQIFLLSGAIDLGLFWMKPLYLSSGHEKEWTKTTIITSVIFIAFSIPAVTISGSFGLALAFLSVKVISAGWLVFRSWKKIL